MSLWKKYSIERFISFEEPSQFFVSDTGSFWESASGLMLYQSQSAQEIHFLSKEILTQQYSSFTNTNTFSPLQIFSAFHKENHVFVFSNYGFFIVDILSNDIQIISAEYINKNYKIDPKRIHIDIVSFSSKGFLFKKRSGYTVVSYDGKYRNNVPVGAYHLDMFTDTLGVAWSEKDGDIVYRLDAESGTVAVAGQTLLPVKSIQCSDWPTMYVSTKKENVLWSRQHRIEIPSPSKSKSHIYETDDDWILDSLNSKMFLSKHRAAINIQGVIHNYILTDSGWNLTYFTSDNQTPFEEHPQIQDDTDFHYGNVIGFSNNPNVPIRKTCYGNCSEIQIEFGSAPISISNDTIFTSTGCLLNKQGSIIAEFYNHFDIKKVLPCENGHVLVFSNQIVLINEESEYPLNLTDYGIEMEEILDTYFEEDNFCIVVSNDNLQEKGQEENEDSNDDETLVQLYDETTAIHIDKIEGIEIKPFRNEEVFDFLHVDGWYCTGVFRLEKDTKLICNDYGLVFLN